MEPRCLLAVYAHPDDEAFAMAGTLSRYSEEGVKTALVYATRGEAGRVRNSSPVTSEALGAVREQELREACRILGVSDLSFLGYQDGAVSQAQTEEAQGRIVYHIRRLRPQVVVTFDETGIYGHPDHIAVHHLTVAAFQKAGDPAAYPEHVELGMLPYAPQKLYFNVIARSVLLKLRYAQQHGSVQAMPGGDGALLPIDQMGMPDEEITAHMFLNDDQFDKKMAAINAHRTQMAPDASFNRAPREKVRQRLGIETFRRGIPPHAYVLEDDLFAGVTV